MKKITCNAWEYLQVVIEYKDHTDTFVLDSCDEILLGENDITIIKTDNNTVIGVSKQLINKYFINTYRYKHCLKVEWLDKNNKVLLCGSIYYNDKAEMEERQLIHLKRAQKLVNEQGCYEVIKRSLTRNV